MVLDRLILTNFKNYAEADIELCGGINCFVGNNGAGKTNILDAAYYLSFCKSRFNAVDQENIRFGEDYFAIHGHYGPDMASCIVRRGKGKEMRWGKKSCRTLAEHIGRVPLVIVAPDDQNLITGGSEMRRKFMDSILSQTDQQYLQHLLAYQKALEQRNRLLKQMWDDRVWDEAMVGLWDVQLATHGDPIFEQRARFIEDFLPLFLHYYHNIATASEPGTIVYKRSEEPLTLALEHARQADKYAQYTTVGPHKDDLLFLLDTDSHIPDSKFPESPLKRFASQGQQKSFSLALKLAQFKYIEQHCGRKPILLLDDIFDKLDMQRVKQLIALVGSPDFGQVLLTDTQPGRVQAIFDELSHLEHRLFTVEKGTVHAA